MEYICLNPKYFRSTFTSSLCNILSPILWRLLQDSKIDDALERKGHITYCNLKNILQLNNGDIDNYKYNMNTE